MRLPSSKILWTLVGVGTAARLIVAFATYGHGFDIDSLGLVRDQLALDPLHVYSAATLDVGGGAEQLRWPYPPAFFAWIAASGALDGPLGLPFHGLVQLPAIVADAALAVLVYAFLRHRGESERRALIAGGLVAAGPSFAVVSGYHGQIDALAILPAAGALVIWETVGPRRALAAGLLIGAGAAVKTVPLLLLLALLPAARDRREAVTVAAAAVAVPALALAPFLLVDAGGASEVLGYSGVPGVAGLSLVVQPALGADWLTGAPPLLSPASEALFDLGGPVTIVALGLVGLFALRFRPSALDGAVLVWLSVYAFSPNLFIHYAVWGLPFLLLAGYLRWAVAAQLALLVPTAIVYASPWPDDDIALLYVPLMIGIWIASLAATVTIARRIARARRSSPSGVQPPLVTLPAPAESAGAPAPLRRAPRSA